MFAYLLLFKIYFPPIQNMRNFKQLLVITVSKHRCLCTLYEYQAYLNISLRKIFFKCNFYIAENTAWLMGPTHVPVSYTHLDVYKRQVLGDADFSV